MKILGYNPNYYKMAADMGNIGDMKDYTDILQNAKACRYLEMIKKKISSLNK